MTENYMNYNIIIIRFYLIVQPFFVESHKKLLAVTPRKSKLTTGFE